jgi:hypothetical protein
MRTEALVYHLRHGDAIELATVSLSVPMSYYPAFRDRRSVILLSGDVHERARIFMEERQGGTLSYARFRDAMTKQEAATGITSERDIVTLLGSMSCFELQTKGNPVLWCLTPDARIVARYEGIPDRLGDMFFFLQTVRPRSRASTGENLN